MLSIRGQVMRTKQDNSAYFVPHVHLAVQQQRLPTLLC